MPNQNETKPEVAAEKLKTDAAAKVSESKPDPLPAAKLDGLVKMHKHGQTIHAHPQVVKEHEKNGWEIA